MAKVHFILDEAASLGHMDCIDDAIDKYRGFGVRLQLYYQSLAQLKKCFPNGQDQTVLANATQVFFSVNDETAEYVSRRVGDATILVESGGTGSGSSHQTSRDTSYGHSTNSSQNWSQAGRRLLKSEEVYALDPRIAVTFVPGLPPILTRLERYYEQRVGTQRFVRVKIVLHTAIWLAITTSMAMVGFLLLWKGSHV